ncbi:GNAT family N-acetyltransferase [Nonomuraea sp. NPDC050536]|uniref:GNAT family N-acetyltransferase n=1 Tax=Nonomuraea sp. NPDC050536 TaxID=3364366 RepID=UPI0037C6C6BF
MIELRVLGEDDWGVWRELRLAALAEAPYAFGSTLADWSGDGDQEERWRARLSMRGSYNLVAVLDGTPVGMASGIPGSDEGTAELVSMWVSPTGRGKGVGDHLIGAVTTWAVARGSHTLELAVKPSNSRAIDLYHRQGFTKTATPDAPTPNGTTHELIMSKRL